MGRQKCPSSLELQCHEQGWELAIGRASGEARAPMKHLPPFLAPADDCVPITHGFASPGHGWAPNIFYMTVLPLQL